MADYAKDTSPKTTIWRKTSDGVILVATLPDLPYGVPSVGRIVCLVNYGKAQCSRVVSSGSRELQSVVEVQFTIR